MITVPENFLGNRDNLYFQQVALIIDLLPLIGEETCFALKGGTAINLFVRDLQSVGGYRSYVFATRCA
jgi:hypothetical protein